MSGNICRCGAYPNIVAAIQQAMAGASHDKFRVLARQRRRRCGSPVAADPPAKFIAGGTNLIDLMKEMSSAPRG